MSEPIPHIFKELENVAHSNQTAGPKLGKSEKAEIERKMREVLWPGMTEEEITAEARAYNERLMGACLATLAETKGIELSQPLRHAELPRIRTSEAIAYFFDVKKQARLKDSSEETYRKRLNQFKDEFPWLPLDTDVIRTRYLDRLKDLSLKYYMAHIILLTEFYEAIKKKYRFLANPMQDINRPDMSGYTPKPNPLEFKVVTLLSSRCGN